MSADHTSLTSPALESTGRPDFMVLSTMRTPPVHLIRSRMSIGEDVNVPGPGAYDARIEWRGNAVRWRPDVEPRSPTKRGTSACDESPVRSQLSSRGTTIGPKLLTKPPDTPGPGSYSPRVSDARVSPRISCTFGVGHDVKSPRSKLVTPGPGTYDPLSPRTNTVQLKSRLQLSTFETPGPGQYEHKPYVGTGLAKTIGTK
mmetsp:Transcript_82977/g.96969  ORF Transcript_82977/g.96969 Transcript_82977/m.96969 type:complete len:201 (+) Transcript_82977:39-641(+)